MVSKSKSADGRRVGLYIVLVWVQVAADDYSSLWLPSNCLILPAFAPVLVLVGPSGGQDSVTRRVLVDGVAFLLGERREGVEVVVFLELFNLSLFECFVLFWRDHAPGYLLFVLLLSRPLSETLLEDVNRVRIWTFLSYPLSHWAV